MTENIAGVLPAEHLERLRDRIRGEIHLPGGDSWDAQRQAWQLLVDQRPAAVVVPCDEADVVAAVAAARELGLAIAPQSTGHAAGTVAGLEGAILLRTGALRDIRVDTRTARTRMGAGVQWGQAVAVAAEHGLTPVAGMAPSVGVVGFTLGGGLGWLARSHGPASAALVAFDAVDAAGRVVHVDEDHHPELLWAARNGAAPVIITAIEVQLYEVPELHAGALLWSLDHAADVVHAWRDWVEDVPDAATSLVRILRYPPIPELPDAVRGRSFVAVEVAVQGGAEAVDALLAPLRALGPEVDTIRARTAVELPEVHGDPVDPAPALGRAVVLAELGARTLDAVLDAALAPSSQALLSIEVRQLGGALERAGIAGGGLAYAVGIVPIPDAAIAVGGALAEFTERIRPHACEQVVKNFAEIPAAAEVIYGPALGRLREIVRVWDPEGRVRSGHPVMLD